MDALMQDWPLTVNAIFRRGALLYGDRRVTTRRVDGLETLSYNEFVAATRRMAGVLETLDLSADARVATFGWNTGDHMQAYFAVPGTGRVLHTGNIRLFPEQLIFTIGHAQDEAILVDRSLLPLLAKYLPSLPSVRHVLVFDDGATGELPGDARVRLYDEVAADVAEVDFADRAIEENRAAALCYTTGTTGDPKGVLYSHRSTFLHAYAGLTTATLGLTDRDTIMPVVPMFHAMAWGIPYTGFLAGANVVMPGPDMSPAGLLDLVQSQKVTVSSGVPTIWMGMLPLLGDYDVSSLRAVMCGGSAVPRSLSEGWRAAIGLPITQGWGMTEISPVGSMSILRAEFTEADPDVQADVRATQGMPLPGVEARIVDSATREELPWDDEATGELEIRGPWVARQYYRTDEPGEQFSADGWLRTGDVAAVSPLGYIRLVDRTKDLIKSGGEWISSVDLENKIMGHPDVAEAAVIAIAHPKWMERPLACVVARPGASPSNRDILQFLAEQGVSRWGLPDDVVFVDELPKTSVGKFSKRELRDKFAGHNLPTS
ncbi:MAG: long-chain fatty acid--CoA ligase [bacterium]